MKLLPLILLLLVIVGCSERDALKAAKQQRLQQGWTFYETFGDVLPDAVEVASMSSETARVVRAFSHDGTNRMEKELKQEEDLFLVVTMQNDRGQTYSVIFGKKK